MGRSVNTQLLPPTSTAADITSKLMDCRFLEWYGYSLTLLGETVSSFSLVATLEGSDDSPPAGAAPNNGGWTPRESSWYTITTLTVAGNTPTDGPPNRAEGNVRSAFHRWVILAVPSGTGLVDIMATLKQLGGD